MQIIRAMFAAFSLALVGAPALAANLVVNGGFETGDFTGWTITPAGSGSLFFVDSAPHTGTYGAAFGATEGIADEISQSIPTAAGNRFTLTFWVFNSGEGSDSLEVRWGGAFVFYENPVLIPSGAWTQLTFSLAASANVTELSFSAFDDPSYIYLDDISVETDNLVVNPSFETGDFTGWNIQPAAAGTLFGVDDFANHTGAYGAYFAAVSNQFDEIWQNLPTVPGRVYIVRFWLADGFAVGDHLLVSWDGAPVYSLTPMPTTASGDWHQVTLALVAGDASSELRFGGFDGPSAFYLDDVHVAEAGNPQCAQLGDADRSGVVNFADITSVLTFWNFSCAP
jgi:hypothetical protein